MSAKQQPNSYPFSAERESRVAEALRENLRKRKAQQQTRKTEATDKSTEE